jgi:hypothetical protein
MVIFHCELFIKEFKDQVQWQFIPVIPASQEMIGRISVQGQPGKNVSKTSSQPMKLGMVAHSCDPCYARGINRRITGQTWTKDVRPYSKNK